MAKYFTDYLIDNEITSIDMREEKIYEFELLLGKIINYGTIIFLAYLNGNLIHTIFFMISFFPLRERTGGFHCKNALNCYFGTVVLYFLVTKMIVPIMLVNTCVLLGIVGISGMIIYMVAPINHPNLELDKNEVKICKSSSRWLALLISTCIIIALWLKIMPVSIPYLAAGMGLDAGLLIVAKITKQEEKKDD